MEFDRICQTPESKNLRFFDQTPESK
jgi:hypothetical protein